MKKVLFVAHVDSHIRHFHIPYLKYFKEKGYEVHVATSDDEKETFPYCDVKHTISFERNPFRFNNIRAIKQMKELFRQEKFELVHCHTPMGGVVARLAAKKARKNGTKVFYTAHGFHFYKGAPLINWLVYYPIEKYLSKYTDVLITINHEDYEIAKNKFKANRIELVHGMGVDDKKFNNEPLNNEKSVKLKKELNIQKNDFVLIYVAELIDRKNQILIINAMKDITLDNKSVKLFLVGNGERKDYYQRKIEELGLINNIKLLGYRNDVNKLLKIADLCVATSKQEGLPINIVEAAFSGLPIIAYNSRGHTEIVKDGINGYIFNSKEELVNKINKLFKDRKLLKKLAQNTRESVKDFSLEKALEEGIKIYESEL